MSDSRALSAPQLVALESYLLSLPRPAQAQAALAIEQGEVPELRADQRQSLLAVVRPALQERPTIRQQSLWRALCCAAEPMFVDHAAQHPGSHWEIPRSLLAGIQRFLTHRFPPLEELSVAYLDKADSPSRVGVLLEAAERTGVFLESGLSGTAADEIGLGTSLPKTVLIDATRLFASCLQAYPTAFHIGAQALGVSPHQFDTLPTLPRALRPALPFEEPQQLKMHRLVEGTPVKLHPALILIQLTMLLRRPTEILLVATEHVRREQASRLFKSPLGGVIDWMIAQMERQAWEIANTAPSLKNMKLGYPALLDTVQAITQFLGSFDQNHKNLERLVTIPAETALGKRFHTLNLKIGHILARDVLAPILDLFNESSIGGRAAAEESVAATPVLTTHERALMQLATMACSLADRNGQRLAAFTARSRIIEQLDCASLQFRPSLLSASASSDDLVHKALAHHVCLCGKAGATKALEHLHSRLPSGWESTPALGACRNGTTQCCALVRRTLGLGRGALAGVD